jgi:hypothetical protein
MGLQVGTSLEGAYNAVPPPGANAAGWGFKKLKRGFKKIGKGVVKAHTMPLKKGYKVTKRVHRVATKTVKKLPGGKLALKIANAPLKAGKYALRAMAKLAAKPLVMLFKKLAGRRANYLAYKRTGSAKASIADKKAGNAYAIAKFKKGGPIGSLAVRILKAVGEAKTAGIGEDAMSTGWREDAAACGMTGAEIAAAVASILAVLTTLVKTLNKKGEAPANPAASEPAPAASVVESPAEEPAEEEPAQEPQEDATEGDDRETIAGRVRKTLRRRRAVRKLRHLLAKRGLKVPPLPPPPPGRRRRSF